MNIFITREICEPGLRLLESKGYQLTTWKEKRELTPGELIDYCSQADALLNAGSNKINAAFLNACPHLKVISLHSVGYDHVDIDEATKLKIPVGHIQYILSEPTADVAFLLMLAVSRNAFSGYRRIKDGDWGFFEPTKHLGKDLKGKTLGIFGMGNIGFEMALKCFLMYGMKVIYVSRSRKLKAEKQVNAAQVSFEELLKESDVLSVHCTLNPDTMNKFNKTAFEQMKPGAIFINTSRGAVHNEIDLTAALEKGTIWGAGLDVTNPEPMDKNNPLLNLPNTAILPHIGSATLEMRNAMSIIAAENIIAALEGRRIPFPVNPEVYERHTDN